MSADKLDAIDEPVDFDYAAADALATRADAAADDVDASRSARTGKVTTTMVDFKGHFSRLFESNAGTANGDATELAAALRDIADAARRLKEEARKEQDRRDTAKAWKEDRDGRGWLEEKWDDFWDDGGDVPGGPPVDPQILETPSTRNVPRENPPPGAGGGGTGTSSVRPSDLTAFATWSGSSTSTLQTTLSGTRAAYYTFVSGCHFGSLEAGPTLTSFDTWLDANDNDTLWATTVADAFTAAGGEGAVSTLANSAITAALQSAGADSTRANLSIAIPTALGNPGTSGYADDPVNTATGNFLENETDLAFTGGSVSLVWGRTYNSLSDRPSAFGPGWASWTEAGIGFDDDAADFVLPDGREITFPRLGDGWGRATGENLWLERLGQGHRVTGNDGSSWELAGTGELTAQVTATGARIELEWAEGRLVALHHARGRSVGLDWEGEGSGARVVAARASDGRTVTYTYDEGRLVGATGPLGTRGYRWDDQGLVSAVVSATGVVEVDNVYDAHRRVSRQHSPFGRTTRYAYLPGRVTVVSDQDGTRSNTWIADRRGRLVGAVDAHEHRQSYSYDAHGNRVLVTERDGSVTVTEHDDRGRRVRSVLPGGADLRWAYDELDRLTEIVTEVGATTRMSYEGTDRTPSLVVDPEGGETRMTWRDGLMSRLVDPTGVEIGFEHDAYGDVVAVRGADGARALFEQDSAGRLQAVVDPLGGRTAYSYDSRGLLQQRTDPDGGVWVFDHDDAGQVVGVTDPAGGRREIERGSHGEVSREVDALGRATGRSYDDLGNLATVELPDGTAWRFAHDALSRLVETTDPTGATWTRAFDEIGTVVGETDPTGVALTGTIDRAANRFTASDAGATLGLRLDGLGRVVSVEQPDGSTVLTRYDRCGRVVEKVDEAGGVTLVVRDAAGRATAVTGPSGAARHFEHDVAGRLSAVVDETGGRHTFERDASGRIVRQTLPDGTVVEQDHDPMGRVVRRRVAGEGTTRIEYDALGRVVASHDPRFGRRTFRRDAAGRVVEVTDARGGTTRYEHDDLDRVTAVVDPLGHRTTRTYDTSGHLVAETDPLGRTSRATYDAAGRGLSATDATGVRLSWSYDAAGRLSSVAVDDRTDRSVSTDLRARRRRVVEQHGDRRCVHELVFDPRGLLVERSRDDLTVRWERDAGGDVRAVTGADGLTTTYERDALGRVVAVTHPGLGRAELERDAAGRVVRASAAGSSYTWERGSAGQVVSHEVVDGEGRTSRVEVRRDGGRVVEILRDGVSTRYLHDEAAQLVAASTGPATTRWHYDAAGRLVEETTDPDGPDAAVRRVEHAYDAAGQLTRTRRGEDTVDHTYDDAGRRTASRSSDGSGQRFGWSPQGRLTSVVRRTADGPDRELALRVDAFGELAEVDGLPVVQDSSQPFGGLLSIGDSTVVQAGPLTGVTGHGWTSPGWREARSGTDPWEPSVGAEVGSGIALGAGGELLVAGLEWLGARAYDPGTHAFLTTDPLDPVSGAAWAANPYSYAGNDPLHALDPLGLSPMTDAELTEFNATNGGWLQDNWEYVAAAGMVVAGGVLIATGVGGPVGMGLISAGVDTAVQKYTTGEVNWGQVVVSGVVGGASAGLGAVTASAVKAGTMSAGRALAYNVGGNAVINGSGNTANYLLGDEKDKSVGGAFGSFGAGAATGAASSLGGPLTDRINDYTGAAHVPGLSGVLQREAPAGLIDGLTGFGGEIANDVATGQEIDWEGAAQKGAGNAAGGGAGRLAQHVIPPDLGTTGAHAAPSSPGRPWLQGYGGHGAGGPVGAGITGLLEGPPERD